MQNEENGANRKKIMSNIGALAAMKQAREALKRTVTCGHNAHECANVRSITALDAAIAQAEREEPVAWLMPSTDSIIPHATKVYRGQLGDIHSTPLYAAPVTVTEDDLRAMLPGPTLQYLPHWGERGPTNQDYYTEDQMLAFARAAIEEARK